MKDFLKITTPLTKLTQKNVKFQWLDVYEESFQRLKYCLTSMLVLVLPSGLSVFSVYYDALRGRAWMCANAA